MNHLSISIASFLPELYASIPGAVCLPIAGRRISVVSIINSMFGSQEHRFQFSDLQLLLI